MPPLSQSPCFSVVRRNIRKSIINLHDGEDWFDGYRIIADDKGKRLIAVYRLHDENSFRWCSSYDFGRSIAQTGSGFTCRLTAVLSAVKYLKGIYS